MSGEKRKWPLADAERVASVFVDALRPFCLRIEVAGSIRRKRPMVGDVEIVYIPTFRHQAIGLFGETAPVNLVDDQLELLLQNRLISKRRSKVGTFAWGEKNKLTVHVASGIPVDFFSTTEDCWFNYLTCRTGGADNNVAICNAAIRKGYKWTPYGAGFYRLGHTERMPSERAVFEFVGLPYLEPKDRK